VQDRSLPETPRSSLLSAQAVTEKRPPQAGASNGERSLWRKLTAWYSGLLSWVLVISVAILVIPVTLQIFSRFTALIPHYIWTEEMARFLFIWTIMIGAMIGVRESSHFEVDVWPILSSRPEAAIRLASRFGVLLIALVFVWSGIEFTRFAWYRTSELAELPLWLIHIAWPIAGFTWLIFLGEQMWDELNALIGRRPLPPPDPVPSPEGAIR
jgi:TRAP-type C4-dicarboxylate transport system permease small subunit